MWQKSLGLGGTNIFSVFGKPKSKRKCEKVAVQKGILYFLLIKWKTLAQGVDFSAASFTKTSRRTNSTESARITIEKQIE